MRVRVTLTISREYEADEENYHIVRHPDESFWETVSETDAQNALDDPCLFADSKDACLTVTVEELGVSPARSMIKAG